jgi:hypothetical protein
MPSSLVTVCVTVAAVYLAGCYDSRIIAPGEPIAPAAKTADHAAVQPANAAIGERLAATALDDSQLSEVRGGFSTGSGMVVNFSFQEATYVNHNLAQSIAVPTMTISPGAGAALAAVALNSVVPIMHSQISSPATAIQSLANNGMTSVVSSLGGGGVTNVVSNSANNQLVQQMITANIGITGLSQALQQSTASTVLSRVAVANSQFR